MQENTLQKKIMRRVYGIYLFKKAMSPVAIQTYVLSYCIVQILMFVSMRHVLSNAPSIIKPIHFARFYTASFINTELPVQILAIGIVTLIIWLGRNIVRNARTQRQSSIFAPQKA